MFSLSPDQFRARFPILKRRVYVNSCSQGALSTDVEAALHEWIRSWHEGGSPWDLWVEQVEVLRAAFAASIGADADEIAVMPAASGGINAIASALDFTGPRRGVVMGEFEFPTMAQAWLAQQRRGAQITWARATGDTLPVDAYEAVVDETHADRARHARLLQKRAQDRPRRREHAVPRPWSPGVHGRLPAHGLRPAQRARAGRRFHGDGLFEVLAVAVRDWLSVCAARPHRTAAAVDHRLVRARQSVCLPHRRARLARHGAPIRERHPASAKRLSRRWLPCACWNEIGYDVVASQIGRLVARFHEAASAAGFIVRTPRNPRARGPLVVVQSVDAPALVERLAGQGVIASARGNGLRISFHAYNNEADVDAVVAALKVNEHAPPRCLKCLRCLEVPRCLRCSHCTCPRCTVGTQVHDLSAPQAP